MLSYSIGIWPKYLPGNVTCIVGFRCACALRLHWHSCWPRGFGSNSWSERFRRCLTPQTWSPPRPSARCTRFWGRSPTGKEKKEKKKYVFPGAEFFCFCFSLFNFFLMFCPIYQVFGFSYFPWNMYDRFFALFGELHVLFVVGCFFLGGGGLFFLYSSCVLSISFVFGGRDSYNLCRSRLQATTALLHSINT